MFLYDDAVLNRYSVDYLETLIADELPASNTAAENSLIDLEFKLAHIGKASDGILGGTHLYMWFSVNRERM